MLDYTERPVWSLTSRDNAELFYSLIHAGARPHKITDSEPDPRPRDKRQADALTSVLTIAATTTETGTAGGVAGFGAKANITVTIDLHDLKTGLATATGQTVYTDDLSAATIRRMACDAKIIPTVLGSKSEPLNVGRVERLVTRGMRRALNTRDKGCVVCLAPPIHCDAHHLQHWSTGGDTALHNLVLLCRRHHIDLHAGHWNITITHGVVHVTRPTWADPPPTNSTTQAPAGTTAQAPPKSPSDTAENNPPACMLPWADEPIPDRKTRAWSTVTPGADPWADPDNPHAKAS